MILLSLIIISCICVSAGVAALASYPLYWGLLAGWLCPSVAVVASITALATGPTYWANRTKRGSRRYWLCGSRRAKNEDSPQQATGYQKEMDSELLEVTKQASGNPPSAIDAEPSSFLDTQDVTRYSLSLRPRREESHQLVYHERKLKSRLQLATTCLEEAKRECIWAVVAAYDAGLSIRKIATATGLSRSHIHQLLQEHKAHEIPERLTHL